MKTTRYAIMLNGEWYSTADDYKKACAIKNRIYSAAEEEDFRRYYGAYPSVDIVPLKD